MAKETLRARGKRSAAKATKIEALLKSLHTSLSKMPEFSGQCRLMDRIKKVEMHAHNLAFDLRGDAQDFTN